MRRRGEELGRLRSAATPNVGALVLEEASAGGAEFPLRAAPGQLLVAFLGFTNCPDVCPAALAEIRAALGRLGEAAEPIDVAMITVDPERDTAEVLTTYVRQVVPDALALRTDDASELQRIVDAFGAMSAVVHSNDGAVDVGHTDYTYLIDDAGDVVLTWTAEMTTDDLVNDLTIFLSRLPG